MSRTFDGLPIDEAAVIIAKVNALDRGCKIIMQQAEAGKPVLPTPSRLQARILKLRGVRLGETHPEFPDLTYITLPEGWAIKSENHGTRAFLSNRYGYRIATLRYGLFRDGSSAGWSDVEPPVRSALFGVSGLALGGTISAGFNIYDLPLEQALIGWLIQTLLSAMILGVVWFRHSIKAKTIGMLRAIRKFLSKKHKKE